MRAALIVTGLVALAACGSEPPPDTGGRSLDVPVPSTGAAATPPRAEQEMFEFPKRAKQDPRKLGVRLGPLGPFLVDANGRALYAFSDDAPGQAACLTNCATVWPPVIVDRMPEPVDAAIDASKLQSFTRPDGARQLSYSGLLLYYSESDLKPGDAWGHFAMSFGGRFTLVSPTGQPLPAPR